MNAAGITVNVAIALYLIVRARHHIKHGGWKR